MFDTPIDIDSLEVGDLIETPKGTSGPFILSKWDSVYALVSLGSGELWVGTSSRVKEVFGRTDLRFFRKLEPGDQLVFTVKCSNGEETKSKENS